MIYRELGCLNFVEMGADWDAFEIVALFAKLLEAFTIKAADFDQFANFCNRFFQVIYFSWRYFQGVSEKIVCEYNTILIYNQTAIGDNRHQRNAVVLRKRLVMVVLLDLQIRESKRQHCEQAKYDKPGKADSELEVMLLVDVVFKFCTHAWISCRERACLCSGQS